MRVGRETAARIAAVPMTLQLETNTVRLVCVGVVRRERAALSKE
jgi:hypothetical protein